MRKKSTRLLSAALAVCMTVTVLPMSAFASGVAELESDVSPQETTAAQSEETEPVAIDEAHFPDEVFREYVKWFDRDSDNILNQDELAKVKELELDPYGLPYGKKISSLEGIKYFTSLETLSCYDNQLSTLDVSSNHKLKNLYCHRNRLSKLVLSKNSELETLSCYGNHLSALDVSSSPELKNLDCRENNLSELDVSQNTELVSLDCSHNKLSALDVSSNSKLNSLDCRENELSELKVSNNPALVSLTCNDNYLSELDVHSSPELKNLYCQDNRLGELDVSENPKLKELYCQNNQLSALDLRSGNQHLKYLFCHHNQLTSLDIDGSDIKLFGCLDNSYNIVVDENNCYDLSKLQGNFDASKVENPQGGSFDAESNILTVDPGATEVTYTYNCGTYTNGESLKAKFTLNVTHHTHHYGDWLRDETDHWHKCTDPKCPEPEESVTETKAAHTFDEEGVCTVCGYQRETAVPDAPAGGSGTDNIQGALSAVVVGAAAGVIIYEAGTGIYRVINMPGIPMPSNRIELAELLWERAGKPEPVSTALYSDIDEGDTDAQKAARWAVEQDLMKDNSEKNTFNPYFPVSKLRVCLTWNAAKEKGLFAKTEE